MLDFIFTHKYFSGAMLAINLVLAGALVRKVTINTSRWIKDAMEGRDNRKTLYRSCISFIGHSIARRNKGLGKTNFYERAREKMKKSGYRGEYAVAVYLLLKYPVPVLLFALSFAANFPSVLEPLVAAGFAVLVLETVIGIERKKHSLRFQKHIYKIYKYLHSQISSGVRVTDAIKTVYEVIEDTSLKEILIQLAARYELTLDIDACLDEFKSNFGVSEAETLCVALKQGIMTGDNQELLARQEEVMFNKYFNYIQAETDSCRTRTTIAAALYTSIIVLMIAIPLFNDVTEAVGSIFAN